VRSSRNLVAIVATASQFPSSMAFSISMRLLVDSVVVLPDESVDWCRTVCGRCLESSEEPVSNEKFEIVLSSLVCCSIERLGICSPGAVLLPIEGVDWCCNTCGSDECIGSNGRCVESSEEAVSNE